MKRFNPALTLALALLLFLFTGCDTGGTTSENASQTGTGDLSLSVDFGPRAQTLNQSNQTVTSILVEIRDLDTGQPVTPSQTLTRPAQGTVATATFTDVPLITVVVSADFFNAAGELLGRDSEVVTLIPGSPILVRLSFSEAISPDEPEPEPEPEPDPLVTREFVVSTNDEELRVYQLDTTTGFLTQTDLQDFGIGELPFSVDIRADGAVYATFNLGMQVRHFQLNPVDGTLSLQSNLNRPLPEGGALSPEGDFFFHCEPDLGSGGSVRVYRLDPVTGELTENDLSPFAIPGSILPQRIFVHPNGRWLYVGEKDDFIPPDTGLFFTFEIDPVNGNLTFLGQSTTAASSSVFAFTVSPDQNTLYVSGNNQVLDLFSINPMTGDLNPLPTFNTVGPFLAEMVVDPQRNILYIAESSNGHIEAYNLDGAGTPTTPLAGSPFSVGDTGTLTLHRNPSDQFLVAGSFGTGTVAVLRVQTNGTLTSVPGSPFTAGVGTFDIDVVELPLP